MPECIFIPKRCVWKGGFIILWYHKMTPPPNLGHSWVVFGGWSQILPSTKLFRHEFEQSCSAMATQKLEEKVQQHDEVVDLGKSGCRRQSKAHGNMAKHSSLCLHSFATPLLPLICDTFARRILCAPTKLLSLLSKSKITPPNFWGSNLKFLG